jgi:hypothetical protein
MSQEFLNALDAASILLRIELRRSLGYDMWGVDVATLDQARRIASE